MTLLSDDQIAADAVAAGFGGSSLVKIIAIDLAESGGDSAARGDVGLQDAKWGPSVGLAQIRSLWSQLGTGGVRDENANYDPVVNQKHAYAISGGGQNFGPWSTFTSGAYTRYSSRAQKAAANVLGGKVPAATDLGFGSRLIGPNPNPVASSSSTAGLSGGSGGLFDAVYRITIFGALAVGAMVLVALGGWKMVSPRVDKVAGQVAGAAAVAA